jgi:integrase
VQRQQSRSGGVFLPLKTKAAKRSIKLSNDMIKALQKHNQLQLKERYEAGYHWKEMDLIFTSTIGTPLNFKNIIERHFKPILKASNVPVIRFHDLRHTAASLMLNNNIPPIVVSRRLGHSKALITLDVYGHLIPSMQSEVAELIDDLVMPVAVQLAKKIESGL